MQRICERKDLLKHLGITQLCISKFRRVSCEAHDLPLLQATQTLFYVREPRSLPVPARRNSPGAGKKNKNKNKKIKSFSVLYSLQREGTGLLGWQAPFFFCRQRVRKRSSVARSGCRSAKVRSRRARKGAGAGLPGRRPPAAAPQRHLVRARPGAGGLLRRVWPRSAAALPAAGHAAVSSPRRRAHRAPLGGGRRFDSASGSSPTSAALGSCRAAEGRAGRAAEREGGDGSSRSKPTQTLGF